MKYLRCIFFCGIPNTVTNCNCSDIYPSMIELLPSSDLMAEIKIFMGWNSEY